MTTMATDSAAAPTACDLRTTLAQLDAEVAALTAKRESLVRRAAERTTAVEGARKELALAQLSDTPNKAP